MDLLDNQLLMSGIIAGMAAQGTKVVIHLLTHGPRGAAARFLETGGMPSSHSAGVVALASGAGLTHGWSSPIFAVCAIFGYIVVYDALGVRRAAGMHAALLNELVLQLRHVMDEGFEPRRLQTLLGHSGPQVLAGVVLGFLIALIVCT